MESDNAHFPAFYTQCASRIILMLSAPKFAPPAPECIFPVAALPTIIVMFAAELREKRTFAYFVIRER